MLVSKARKNTKFIAELFDKPNMEELKFEIIEKVINDLFEKDAFVDSA